MVAKRNPKEDLILSKEKIRPLRLCQHHDQEVSVALSLCRCFTQVGNSFQTLIREASREIEVT